MISRFVKAYGSAALLMLFCTLLQWCVISHAHLRGSGTEPLENLFQSALVHHPMGSFPPLECNAHLNEAECEPWSDRFFGSDGNTTFSFHQRITIPCGQCVEIDRKLWGRGDDLVLHDGLDVQGKLVFPPNSHLKVKTTFLLVQGELHIYSSKAINGIPAVTITWMDSQIESPPRPIAFRPPKQQKHPSDLHPHPCGVEDFQQCDLGERPFVVAGGKVVIQGLPSPDMPSWVPLLDVDGSKTGWHVPEVEYQQYVEPSQEAGCPLNGNLILHTFNEPPPSYITGSWGAFTEWTGESLKITRRGHHDHGFVIDTREIRHCLSAKATYLVTAKVRIPSTSQGPTQCATTGRNCIKLLTKHKWYDSMEEQTLDRWTENQSHQTEYGKVFSIHTHVKFLEQDVRETTMYQIFYLQGSGPGEDIELLEFNIQLPPQAAFADPETICANLVPGNGDAELFPLSPFPFQSNSDFVQIRTATEHSNRYFEVLGREVILNDEESSGDNDKNKRGVTWNIPPSCIKAKATYRFRANVRVHSETPVVLEWNVHGTSGRISKFAIVARCPASHGNWVQCKGGLTTLPTDIVHAHHVTVVAETLGTYSVNYDVDELSFELVDGPIDRLILPHTIKNNWVRGAHLVVTSQSPAWDRFEFVEIKDVFDHDEDSVEVEISWPIQSPITIKDSRHYATEVALLSRNILFKGGGHFTVLHTPNVPQVIEGADFDGWGVPGVRDRYPIHFDNCQDAKGTIVRSNTIRHSSQRGIVLHATNNVRIESNVALNVTGHGFGLESGSEQGNSFIGNLGVYNRAQSVDRLMPQMGVSGKETDDTPATFWITNPMNDFIGNVATGSEGHGFWLQLRETPRGPHASEEVPGATNALPLGIFDSNVIHSVNSSALRVTGYHPTNEAKIVGLTVYWSDGGTLESFDSMGLSVINPTFDMPVVAPEGVAIKNPRTSDVRGCSDDDDSEADAVGALLTATDRHPFLVTPSAPSVFRLQEMS